MTKPVLSVTLFLSVFISSVLLLACSKSPQPVGQQTLGVADDSQSGSETPAERAGTNKVNWPDDIESTSVPMELKKMSTHTYYVEGPPGTPTDNQGFMSNAGVVVTNEGVVVFDALGTPSLAYKLYMKIRSVTDQPVVKVVTSHYHADHIYGLQVFKDLGAEIIAPAGAQKYLASDSAMARLKQRRESLFPWVDENTHLVKPDRIIDKDTVIKVGDVTLKLLVLGSTHSDGDMMMRVEPDDVLFSGDLIFEGRIPFVAGSNPDNWLRRLKELDTNGLKAIIPGHGSASTNPQQAKEFTLGYLQYLYKTMGEAVDNLMAFDQAYQQTDWSQYKDTPAFVANHMNAYFIYLRLEEKSMQ